MDFIWSLSLFYEAAFFQWLLFDHICLNKACHNLRRVFNLSMYRTNIIPHGKCLVRCLHTRCFVSEISRVHFAHLFDFDTPQLMCKHRTCVLSMKYSIFISLLPTTEITAMEYGCRIVAIFNNIQFTFSNSNFCSVIHIFVQ